VNILKEVFDSCIFAADNNGEDNDYKHGYEENVEDRKEVKLLEKKKKKKSCAAGAITTPFFSSSITTIPPMQTSTMRQVYMLLSEVVDGSHEAMTLLLERLSRLPCWEAPPVGSSPRDWGQRVESGGGEIWSWKCWQAPEEEGVCWAQEPGSNLLYECDFTADVSR